MKKFTLEAEADFNFLMIGISCHLNDYRFCWFLNQALETDFDKTNDHIIYIGKKEKEPIHFNLFAHIDEENHREYLLLNNKSDKKILIPEYKTIDYFLIIKGTIFDEEIKRIIQLIKNINNVLLVCTIIPEDLKSKNNLIFD